MIYWWDDKTNEGGSFAYGVNLNDARERFRKVFGEIMDCSFIDETPDETYPLDDFAFMVNSDFVDGW